MDRGAELGLGQSQNCALACSGVGRDAAVCADVVVVH